MRLDYDYIKKILLTMENYNKHQIYSKELMGLLEIGEEDLDKFIGHIKLLADNYFIFSSCEDLGFKNGLNGNIVIGNPLYRITSQGYEFLDILRNDTILKNVFPGNPILACYLEPIPSHSSIA